MPFIYRSMFEKHNAKKVGDDNLHVEAISNPEVAAHVAALKLVMNTHLHEKLQLIDSEKRGKEEYIKAIIAHKTMDHLLHDIINQHLGKVTSSHTLLGRGL